jgi:hypothetical protein
MPRLFVALGITVALGLLSRLRPVGCSLYDKSLGDVLYAVAAYLTLALLLIRRPALLVTLLALVVCVVVEAFKLTGLPAHWAHLGAVRWLLGTTFSWHNLVCYAIGVALITGCDLLLLRPGHGGR